MCSERVGEREREGACLTEEGTFTGKVDPVHNPTKDYGFQGLGAWTCCTLQPCHLHQHLLSH